MHLFPVLQLVEEMSTLEHQSYILAISDAQNDIVQSMDAVSND